MHGKTAIAVRDRFVLWRRQVEVDAAASDAGAVRGDLSALEWIRDRFAFGLGPLEGTRLDTDLTELRALATDGDFGGVERATARLRGTVERASLST